jgi:surface protein
VTDMFGMFEGSHSLISLDLSSFDTSGVRRMERMFNNTRSLRELTLGENFNFVGTNHGLMNAPINAYFTGYWVNVGTGCVDRPQANHRFATALALAAHHNANPALETWVWESVAPPAVAPIIYQMQFFATWVWERAETMAEPVQVYQIQFSIDSELPVTWSADNLPQGFSLNESTGTITINPAFYGMLDFTIRAESSAGYDEWAIVYEIGQ